MTVDQEDSPRVSLFTESWTKLRPLVRNHFEISVGHVKKLLHVPRQQRDAARSSHWRPRSPAEDQKQKLIQLLLSTAESGTFSTKREPLAEVEQRCGKILTYGWVQTAVTKHTEQITAITIHPQKDSRLQSPQQVLNDYHDLIGCHVAGMNS
jgi:hypothetical protein